MVTSACARAQLSAATAAETDTWMRLIFMVPFPFPSLVVAAVPEAGQAGGLCQIDHTRGLPARFVPPSGADSTTERADPTPGSRGGGIGRAVPARPRHRIIGKPQITECLPISDQSVKLEVNDRVRVSALWEQPPSARACLVLAHGAGAGMRLPFMSAVAGALAERAIAALRYQFPYMERGGGRPDPPQLCYATVRAAVAMARSLAPRLPCFAGGKSFGGRMTSQAAAESPLPSVSGLVFFGFPLHAPGNPGDARGEHLGGVALPMLFLQGTRDAFAELGLLQGLIGRLSGRATLKLFQQADHSFHVPARSGSTDQQVLAELADSCSQWMLAIAAQP
jgi:uncharacterized protein